jgi:hypothetical protein
MGAIFANYYRFPVKAQVRKELFCLSATKSYSASTASLLRRFLFHMLEYACQAGLFVTRLILPISADADLGVSFAEQERSG